MVRNEDDQMRYRVKGQSSLDSGGTLWDKKTSDKIGSRDIAEELVGRCCDIPDPARQIDDYSNMIFSAS
jgi:hypothetical protein